MDTIPGQAAIDQVKEGPHGEARSKLADLIMYMVNLATEASVCISGFVWGVDPPVIIRFSNTADGTAEDMRKQMNALCDMLEDRRKNKMIDQIDLSKVAKA